MKFTNNATTTLASGINSSATSLTVATGTGVLFPTLSAGDYFYCTLANTSGIVEIIQVTARSTDTFTVVRGQDNTSAASWNTGDKVELRIVAAVLNDIPKLDATNNIFTGTGAIGLPVGTTAQEPSSPSQGMLRFNSSTSQFEGYNGSAWSSVGGAAISNDTSTSSARYPLFASATSGTALTVYTSNANYLYTPSTGQLQAPEVLASNGLLMMSTTIATSATVPTGSNAIMVGPYSVSSGASLTISTGQRMVVL